MDLEGGFEMDQEAYNMDLVIIGGGVTGAGVFREAVRNGLRVLLVEKRDFAWGTSSRSSKLIHGGLRYLKEAQFRLTLESVKERERLLEEAADLVSPIDFIMPLYKDGGPGRAAMAAGLTVYDILARKFRHRYLGNKKLKNLVPGINTDGLTGGYLFMDAQVDDARLVQRLIEEGTRQGGKALNYTAATRVVRNDGGKVCGVEITDAETGATSLVATTAVVNATGVWAEELHPSPESGLHLRPLRGSHLVFPREVLPVDQAISFFHPDDQRPLFVIPWEGVVLLGTTDLDHDGNVNMEPWISEEEVAYLLEAVSKVMPHVKLTREDAITSFAGVRPVLSEGGKSASQESREHAVWVDEGLVTVTGGKLTTFRRLAWDTLKSAGPFIRSEPLTGADDALFCETMPCVPQGMPEALFARLWGRYGMGASAIAEKKDAASRESIGGSPYIWGELSQAAGENVRHLDDLMLRRLRLGMVLENGGIDLLDRIRDEVQAPLGWDDATWEAEAESYKALWTSCYSPAPAGLSV